MSRTVIAGGPRCGKTTLALVMARRLGFPTRHTDDLVGRADWSEASAIVARWFDEEGPWIVEGVACARALRKWLAQHPTGTPCDRVVLQTVPFVPLSTGQAAMARGCDTVWREIAPELRRRGVDIVTVGAAPAAEGSKVA